MNTSRRQSRSALSYAHRRGQGLAWLLLLGAAILLTGCSRGSTESDDWQGDDKSDGTAETEDRVEGVPVEVALIESGAIARSLKLTGTLEAEQVAKVLARLDGLVTEVLVKVGDTVTEGQELCRLEKDDIQLDLADAESQIEQAAHLVDQRRIALAEATSRGDKARREAQRASTDRDRQQSLFERNLIPVDTNDAAKDLHEMRKLDLDEQTLAMERAEVDLQLEQSKLGAHRTNLERIKLRLARHDLRSPIAGVVTAVEVDPFDRLSTGAEAFTVMNPSALLLRLRVPEASSALLRAAPRTGGDQGSQGNSVSLTAESRPGLVYSGRVSLVSPVVDPASGTVEVEVLVDAKPVASGADGESAGATAPALSPGMFTSCAIETDRHEDVLLVEKRALIYDEGLPVVFIADDENRAQRVPLRGKMGLDDEWHIEIDHEDLPTGARVIVVGQANLKHGSRVSIIEPEE